MKEFTFMFRKTGLTTKEFKEKYPLVYKEEMGGRRLERQERLRLLDERQGREREEKEFMIVKEKIREKKVDWLGKWVEKFSEKGTWDLARYRDKKDDWL